MSNAPSKPVSFSRPKVGYFSNRPRIMGAASVTGLGLLAQHVNKLDSIELNYRAVCHPTCWHIY